MADVMEDIMAWFGFKIENQSRDQLNERGSHRTVSVGDSLYAWAGKQDGLPDVHDSEEKRRITSNIQHFIPSTGQWITRHTTGTPPLGVRGYCCTAIKDQLYYFGGWCGHDDCDHNSITQLDTVQFQWRELEPTDANRPVMRRAYGGMISFEDDRVHHLLMIGGYGSKPAVQLPHYKYIKLPNENWCTNEHSIYNLLSRKWNNPVIIGQSIPPPMSDFVIEKINNTRAVLFGGLETDDDAKDTVTNNIYILEISIGTVLWQCIKKPEAIDQWPVGRGFHAGAIITARLGCPMLVISGGRDNNNDTLDDCWIFNVTQYSWTKLDIPHIVRKRWGHSLSAFIMNPHCVWMITVGGAVDERQTLVINPNIVMLTELVKGEWTVGETFDTNEMNSQDYKKKYQQQLQSGRRIWLEEYQKRNADIELSIQALMKSLEEREKEKESETQIYYQQLLEQMEKRKKKEIMIYRHQLQEKDRELHVVLQENQEALLQKDIVILEKDRELQKKDWELHQSQESVLRYQQQAELTDDHWVINKDEVTLTKEELGIGSYAVVTVGIFRGLRVAVKSLHTLVISNYNRGLFCREMSMASQIRHPNLVQFIGATKVGTPLILTELMSTNLYKKLQEIELTNQQIFSIAQEVALGLNYLHLFQPQPIIHRDVSSPNILLKPCTGPAGYEAKVADYGTAKLQQSASTGTVMPGNPSYAAPEAPIPDQHSPAMDVYSYSVLLIEMNLRRPPEMTTAERRRQAGNVSWLDMKSLIQRGLHANPRGRPTMAQVLKTLNEMRLN
ncbi:PREDICTED: uncharacterized protein LOC109583419 isoform X2 [Amphimedon queenslandica]|uniref:Protein kinase domain-containing protein n=1 Tax=Amphimedon queenslandica TaxID=400682 RepID=A0AAN0JBD1_AMPQE|nr:PREDICTED: uncharacterized protein LOC109583419 isoform X2 [Amphimedon queenslandica]|eukprot:XP_019854320.1 PREDICTED: uncharacterized protein LOC109583419 isoform X2 [Amphimedon queenslandica]